MKFFFGGVLLVTGVLLATVGGLCSGMLLVQMKDFFSPLMFFGIGGGPLLLGFFAMKLGRRMMLSNSPKIEVSYIEAEKLERLAKKTARKDTLDVNKES